jgi:C_GCAxxG_C_C family probable redox protein
VRTIIGKQASIQCKQLINESHAALYDGRSTKRGLETMKAIDPSAIREAAERSFSAGLYCAESVALALARAQGVDSENVARIATGFCSGIARTRGTCGALSGAVMGVGLALGRAEPGEPVQACYAATQRLVHQFEQEFGAKDCHRLLGCDLGTPAGQAEFREKGLGARCLKYTGRAAEMAATILVEAAGRGTARDQGLT